jgi:ATP-dependent helicase/nuclease subunit B
MQEQVASALKQGATIITATRRLARSFRNDYNAMQQARGLKAWESPKILTWSGWMNDLWQESLYSFEKPPISLGPWQELLLWERIIRDSPESGALLQIHTTASLAQEAWLLASQWRMDPVQIESQGNEDARAFAVWAQRFRETCAGEGWVEQARIADVLKEAISRLKLPSSILLAGFDELTPQQKDFLQASSHAGCNVLPLDFSVSKPAAGAVRVPFPDPEQEIEAAARWARALLEAGAAGEIGVVVAGLSSRRNLVERIFRTILEPTAQLSGDLRPSRLINLSAGHSLAAYPMIQSALAILSLSPTENHWSRISSLLRNPYLFGSDTEYTKRALLDAGMRRDCGNNIPMSYLRQLCREHAPQCLLFDRALSRWLAARAQSPPVQTIGQWARSFSTMLEAFGWPGERKLNSIEYQTMQAWTELLSVFASTDLTGGSISFAEAISLIKRIAVKTMFQPETEQASVQILGVLEASGLFFNHLWIAGLHDEVWPAEANPNPFLPLRLQRDKGIPRCSPERELEFAALITRRLLSGGSDVVLSYPEREKDRELGPSPLIASIPIAARNDLRNGVSIVDIIKKSEAIERFVDEKGPPLIKASRQRGGTKVFQYQAGCPFRAFVELRLGAEALEFPVPGLDPRQRGILVHSALEEIWKHLKTHSALCASHDLFESVRRSVDYGIDRLEQSRGAALPRRFAELERERLQRLIMDWLEFEKTRLPFEVVQPEEERFAEVSGIRFKVKIDRIDRLTDGREVIIDYKTGMPNPRSWETDRPDEPQLPLYSTIHEKPLAGVLFAQIKIGKLRFLGIVDNDIVIPGAMSLDLAARIQEWRSVLGKLALDFQAGRAEVNPKSPSKQCHYCPLVCMCRIAEIEDSRDEEEDI